MSHLQVVTINEIEKWDKIVKSFKQSDVYYFSGYSKAFQLHGDGEPHLFYYEDYNIRAINVVMKRDIENDKSFTGKLPKDSYFDITTPYGYGGFLVEGKNIENSLICLDKEYSSFCKNNGIICEFVRFHPILKNSEKLKSIYDITVLGKTVSMNLHSVEQIWSDLTSKNRNMVRKAKKSGVKISWGQCNELYREFIQLYNATMDKDNAKAYYYFNELFYDSILDDLKYNSLVFYAVYQGKIIAMAIVLFANQQMHYHLSASSKEFQTYAPSNLLLYEAACYGIVHGYKTFHLGGGLGGSEDSLYRFKSVFNSNSCNDFEIGRKIFDVEKYDRLVGIRKPEIFSLNNVDFNNITSSFFPEYRAEIKVI